MAVRPANPKSNEMAVHHNLSPLGIEVESLLLGLPGVLIPGVGVTAQQNEGERISILSPARSCYDNVFC